jgi:murein DD-endopeptidase MepM/ murein hydrolase activator NlpD
VTRFKPILAALGVAAALGLLWIARELGLLMNALFALIVISTVLVLTQSVLQFTRRRVAWSVYRQPRAHLPQLAAVVLRMAAWLVVGYSVHLAIVPIQFEQSELTQLRALTWVGTALLVSSAAIPRERRWTFSDVGFFVLLVLSGYDLARGLAEPPSGAAVALRSPFETPAYVLQGGASPLFNHHSVLPQQAWALDLVLLQPNGRESDGNRANLAAYACFGAPILAPITGRVVQARADRPDMAVGTADHDVITGNSITLQSSTGQYVLLAHLQAGSVAVAIGDSVVAGQRIARCGNSGSTTAPHLHLQAQNLPEFANLDPALRTFPLLFEGATRLRSGERRPSPFGVRRNDIIFPLAP